MTGQQLQANRSENNGDLPTPMEHFQAELPDGAMEVIDEQPRPLPEIMTENQDRRKRETPVNDCLSCCYEFCECFPYFCESIGRLFSYVCCICCIDSDDSSEDCCCCSLCSCDDSCCDVFE